MIYVEVYVARQPIFDRNRNEIAYEILYRDGMSNRFPGINGDEATSHVIVNAYQNFGISTLTAQLPAFINFTEKLIYEEVGTLFSPELLVIEILETVRPTTELLARCRELKKRGYRIALDDFLFEEGYLGFLEVADIIKVDFLNSNQFVREEAIKKYHHYNVEFLAEKIETEEDFELAKQLGYKYFQGYFFSKPQMLITHSVQPLQMNYIRLIRECDKADIDMTAITKIISEDLGLTYSILRLINSPFFGLNEEVQSVEQALSLMGESDIKKWITLLSLKGLVGAKQSELTRLSMQRAKCCELIAERNGFNKEVQSELFLMGLLSLIDVILGTTIQDVLQDISVSCNLRMSLLDGCGPYFDIYQQVLTYESTEWDNKQENQLCYSEVDTLYLQSIYWTKNFDMIYFD